MIKRGNDRKEVKSFSLSFPYFFTFIVSISSVTVIVSVFFETAVKPRKRAPVKEIFGYGFHP